MVIVMRSAYLVEPRKIEIRDVPDPKLESGELLVRIERALTCGTDLKAYRRGHPLIPMPGPFGHQYAGEVAAVGQEVKGFEIGMPVWGVQSGPCGQCRQCQKQRYSLCPELQTDMAFGAFAEYLRLPARVVRQNLLGRPPDMPAQRAAFLEPVSCVVHALERIDWQGVDRVLVLGLGAMGLLFCQLLPHYTHAAIVAGGRNRQRLAIARGYGLEQVLDVEEISLKDQLEGDRGVDCVIECTGQIDGWHAALGTVDAGGQVLFFGGLPQGTVLEIDTFQLHYQETRVLGSFHFGPPDVRKAARLLENSEVRVDALISGEMGLDDLESALKQMEAGQGIKYAIDPWM